MENNNEISNIQLHKIQTAVANVRARRSVSLHRENKFATNSKEEEVRNFKSKRKEVAKMVARNIYLYISSSSIEKKNMHN